MADTGIRRRLGAVAGAGIAGAVLPGITLGPEGIDAVYSVLLAGVVIAVLTQLVHIGPSGPVPAPALLAFGAAGFVQDSLIWWLLSWLGEEIAELRVEGVGTILLAGLVTRVSILAFSLIGTSATPED
ncbi:hypothetical protein J7E93_29100 [Streptomyces sp. ISL-36]|uniref:hypothetical protein n=1 Tax=Streptomyces sp. ISL-36 TaxID=2819182 RepID=UPI001BE5FD3F|nr:hypothetical protein [Streptomyces sp. ISL-36]MBT2444079.1 hypothetical protein [Streptomyces sp. ISL-36]